MNVISLETDTTLSGIAARCEHVYPVASLEELPELLERVRISSDTLDLIGHSTRGQNYLRIGQTPIDMFEPRVQRSIGKLSVSVAAHGVRRIRLLGCETAVTPAAQRTMVWLSQLLEIVVLGTTKPLMKSHYIATGFNPRFNHLLIESSSLPSPRRRLTISPTAERQSVRAVASRR